MRIFFITSLFLLSVICSNVSEGALKDIAIVIKDNKYGIIDANGVVLVSCSYEYLKITCSDLIVAKKEGKFGFIDRYGKMKIGFLYEATTGFYNQKAVVTQNGKDKFINEKGKQILGESYESATIFSEGLAGVASSGLWRFIDGKGKTVLPARFDFVFAFYDGYCIASENHKFGVINKKGESVIPFEYDAILPSNTPLVFIAYKKLRGTILKITNNTYKNILQREAYRFTEVPNTTSFDRECEEHLPSGCVVFQDDSVGFLNLKTGKIRGYYDKIKPLSLYYFSCEKEQPNGTEITIIDTSGGVAGDFRKYNVEGVADGILFVNSQEGGLIGGVTFKKDTVINFVYTAIFGMRNTILLVGKDDGYYLIKKNGEKVSSRMPFDIKLCVFFEKIILVKSGDKYGVIDYKGNVLQQPQFDKAINFYPNSFSE